MYSLCWGICLWSFYKVHLTMLICLTHFIVHLSDKVCVGVSYEFPLINFRHFYNFVLLISSYNFIWYGNWINAIWWNILLSHCLWFIRGASVLPYMLCFIKQIILKKDPTYGVNSLVTYSYMRGASISWKAVYSD